jgi:transcriptional repressor NrdR
MKCPHCQASESKVIESRDVAGGESIRRRRECLNCQHRYTTYERLERPAISVIKKDGLEKACEKTTITSEQFEELVSKIEKAIYDHADGQITSQQIGNIIMDALAGINQVAYVRFASVYRNFTDIESFERELSRIKTRIGVPGYK